MAPSSDSGARRLPLFGSLCALVFLVNFGRVVFAPLVVPLQEFFVGTSNAAVGLVATLAWLGSALPRLPAGYLLTRVARHRVVLGTGGLLTVASGGMTLAPTIELVMVGALFVGLASGVYFVAASPLVSELFPDRVGRVIGIHGTASQLAAAVAPLLVVRVLLVRYTWRAPFYLLSAAAAVVTVVLYVTAERADLPDAAGADRDLLGSVRRQYRIVALGVATVGITGLVWNGFFNFYPKYLIETKGVTKRTANLLLTVVFAAGVPAFWYTGRLADRFRHVPLMLAILGSFVVTLFAITVVNATLAVAAVSLCLGYAIHSLFPAIDTFLLDSLPDSDRGSAYAGYSASMMLVQALGSVVVGTLRGTGFAYDTIFRTGAAGLGVLAVCLVALQWAGRLPQGAS
ncbi:MFS transporter [Halobacterium salinarum]|uniref:MFS transporter n=1 Tax=Halobacterium salinarum TaxID=2242 RepID=UPI0025563A10|nr:MFS transporter [Halobacterium salinarum]MDL0120165.1 MFS transporter [Halobacterium salinarum]